MRYLTDGTHLYEVAAQRTVTNYGRLRGTISYVIIRDCVSEAIATIDDLHLAALTEVTATRTPLPDRRSQSRASSRDGDRRRDVGHV